MELKSEEISKLDEILNFYVVHKNKNFSDLYISNKLNILTDDYIFLKNFIIDFCQSKENIGNILDESKEYKSLEINSNTSRFIKKGGFSNHFNMEKNMTELKIEKKSSSIFISHSSKDHFIIEQFIEKILILGCGLRYDQVFCTSIDGLGIKTGEDFRNHIRKNLLTANFSFLMISENYKRSEVCLNEMGASWAIDNLKIRQLIFPKLGFESLGLLLNVKQASRIDKSADLDELFEELTNHFETEKKVSRWNKHKTEFLNTLNEFEKENSNQIFPSPNEYFSQYLKENASLNNLLLNAHPTLLDCKAIFDKSIYKKFFAMYCTQFEVLTKEHLQPLYPSKKSFRVIKTNTMVLNNGVNNIAGGLVELAQKGYFNYNVEFYEVTFLENEKSEFGISFKVFCYVNDKWVFFPKPWRINEKLIHSK